MDLQAAPQDARTTAVTLGCPQVSPEEQGGMVIYDDPTPRPTKAPGFGGTGDLFDSVQWGIDDTAIYASNYEDTGFDFYNLTVNSSGVTLNHDYGNDFPGFYFRIHYDSGTQLVYGDDGNVVTPSTGLPAGTFPASGWMVPDSTLNAAFFLGQTQSQQGGTDFTIESFNLTRFTPVGSVTIPSVTGNPLRLIRWGQNGSAFNTDAGEVYLISGSFVSSVPGAAKNNMNEPSLEPVRRPASFWRAILTRPN